jgi:hypothetical protein
MLNALGLSYTTSTNSNTRLEIYNPKTVGPVLLALLDDKVVSHNPEIEAVPRDPGGALAVFAKLNAKYPEKYPPALLGWAGLLLQSMEAHRLDRTRLHEIIRARPSANRQSSPVECLDLRISPRPTPDAVSGAVQLARKFL